MSRKSDLELEFKQFWTVEELTKWALNEKPPRVFPDSRFGDHNQVKTTKYPGFDLYIQDEYTHDLVLPHEEFYLVFDTT